MKYLIPSIILTTSCLLTSCKDDPELVKKRDQQKAEIARLDGEITNLNVKLADAPENRSEELKEAKEKAETQMAEITKLEAEVSALQSQKAKMEADFKSYQSKYRVNK